MRIVWQSLFRWMFCQICACNDSCLRSLPVLRSVKISKKRRCDVCSNSKMYVWCGCGNLFRVLKLLISVLFRGDVNPCKAGILIII